MKKFSFMAAVVLASATALSAANDLVGMFKDGKLNGRLRAQYFYTDWEDNSFTTGKGGDDAKGLALGGSLRYLTAPLHGISFGAGLYTTQNPASITDADWGGGTPSPTNTRAISTTSNDLFLSGDYGKGYSVFAEAYLRYTLAKTILNAGRILVNNPFMTPNDTKMIPVAAEGYTVENRDLDKTVLYAAYITKEKERSKTTFNHMMATADTPDKLRTYYQTNDAPNLLVIGAKNSSIERLELQVWGMNLPDVINLLLAEANYMIPFGNMSLTLGGRYMKQFDEGAGNIILPKTNNNDSDQSVDTDMLALRAITAWKESKLLLAWSHTSNDGDLIAPWRGFPTQGYTRSMTQTDWNANTKAYKVQFDQGGAAIGLKGTSFMLSYSFYDRDPSKKPYQSMTDRGYQNGDTSQWNLDVVYKLAGSFKGTEFKVRLMDQQNDTTASYPKETSNREMRLEANYRF